MLTAALLSLGFLVLVYLRHKWRSSGELTWFVALTIVASLLLGAAFYANVLSLNTPGSILILAGLGSNALVVLANNGRMPAIGGEKIAKNVKSKPAYQVNQGRLLFLADRQKFWYASPGDILMFVGLVLVFLPSL